MTNEKSKQCEVCLVEIPQDYQNLLCDSCYTKQVEEIEQKKQDENKVEDLHSSEEHNPTKPKDEIIRQEGYRENPEMEDKPQWEANITLFTHNDVLLWKPTKGIYTYIRDYMGDKIVKHPQFPKFVWKPTVVDVGCGSGVGANILSQESDFVWGIDKNLKSVKFAQEAFTRVKNQYYWSPQISFDHVDIMKDTRDFMNFDVVVAVEIIEHVDDYKGFLTQIIKKFAKKDKKGNYVWDEAVVGANKVHYGTEWFISTPNRLNKSLNKEHPNNIYHVREFAADEFYDLLSEFFNNVEFFTALGVPIPQEEYRTTHHTPLLAKCSHPKI